MRTALKFPATIGDTATALGVSPQTLRYLELRGVVNPERDSSGRRLYLPDDIERIRTYRAVHGRK